MKTVKHQLIVDAPRNPELGFTYNGPSDIQSRIPLIPAVGSTRHPSKPDLNSDTQRAGNRPRMPVKNGSLRIAQQHIVLPLHVLVLSPVPTHIFQSCSYCHHLSISVGYYPISITITMVLQTPSLVCLPYSSSTFSCCLGLRLPPASPHLSGSLLA